MSASPTPPEQSHEPGNELVPAPKVSPAISMLLLLGSVMATFTIVYFVYLMGQVLMNIDWIKLWKGHYA
jgi:hypothetical protein